ncbi:uncharacterized protein [Penaeus vannamei]|uniref:uncharacterized protein n=1 Tax=Penaeus vannamei TaxID=6689 RepID=UPI00387F4B7F
MHKDREPQGSEGEAPRNPPLHLGSFSFGTGNRRRGKLTYGGREQPPGTLMSPSEDATPRPVIRTPLLDTPTPRPNTLTKHPSPDTPTPTRHPSPDTPSRHPSPDTPHQTPRPDTPHQTPLTRHPDRAPQHPDPTPLTRHPDPTPSARHPDLIHSCTRHPDPTLPHSVHPHQTPRPGTPTPPSNTPHQTPRPNTPHQTPRPDTPHQTPRHPDPTPRPDPPTPQHRASGANEGQIAPLERPGIRAESLMTYDLADWTSANYYSATQNTSRVFALLPAGGRGSDG